MYDVFDDDLMRADFAKASRLLRRSGHVHGAWYRRRYPDVAALGLEPVEHYLRIGAGLGRNPGRNFDTRFYLETYPEVLARGQNPLLHYVREGQAKGYLTRPRAAAPSVRVRGIRDRLLTLGLTEPALDELTRLSRGSDPALAALAARDLASWDLRQRSPEACRSALDHLAVARRNAPDLDFRARLVIAELLCHHFLDDPGAGRAAYERAALAGEITPDAFLARANLDPDPDRRCGWINRALAAHGLAPIHLARDPDAAASLPYDHLAGPPDLAPVQDGPVVTVLMAAYNSAGVIPTALRSLQAQTWRNLEILVIDDCSQDATCAVVEQIAAADPRVRLIRMERNGGAYVARNRGLDATRGDFVTLHDADDWSHPSKIEIQMRHMLAHPDVMGCTSDQARATEDLRFAKVRGNGAFVIFNTSSFLWRREPVRAALGYWDTVRFGADNEFIRRVQAVFGKAAVAKLGTGPLSLQRDSAASITTDPVMGVDGFYYGVRKEYHDAHLHHHARGPAALRYSGDPAERPFPVPPMMRPDRAERLREPRRFDLVVYGDFRRFDPALADLAGELEALARAGRRVGLVECPAYAAEGATHHALCDEIRTLVDGAGIEVLVYGEEVTAARIRRLPGAGPEARYLPVVRPDPDASDAPDTPDTPDTKTP